MEKKFVIKRGYISQGDSSITGSLVVSNGITGSFSGSFIGDGSGLTGLPQFVSTDENNAASLGADGLIFVPDLAPLIGDISSALDAINGETP
jgi:hypothetical protein